MAEDEKGALYVSAVEGHVCTRYGTGGLYIGVTRDQKDPSKLAWDTKAIVFIPPAEASRYLLEYSRDLAAGSLTKRTSDEYAAQVKAEEETAKKLADEAAAAAKKLEAEKSKSAAKAATKES